MKLGALAFALLAAPFVFSTLAASAQDRQTPSCWQGYGFNNVAEVIEELSEFCGPSVITTVEGTDAIEGFAIKVDVTQAVTVAAAGEIENADITGSTSIEAAVEAEAEPQAVVEAEANNPLPNDPYSYILP